LQAGKVSLAAPLAAATGILARTSIFLWCLKTSGKIHEGASRKQDKFDFKPRNIAGYKTERAFTDV
jgi:hypothetical protein